MIRRAYLHLPFCLRKCRYCDFAVHALGQQPERYADLTETYLAHLRREVAYWHENFSVGSLKSIYFGGGTPSIYEPDQLKGLLAMFETNSQTEVTLELDPGTFDAAKLNAFLDAGFNRFSMGV